MTLIKQEYAIKEIESAMETSESIILNAGLACAKGIIASLPSAEADWIPCSEMLPNTAEQVLISVCDDHGDTPYHYTCVGWRCENYWISDNDYVFGNVLAWMPLPKPWKGEDDDRI